MIISKENIYPIIIPQKKFTDVFQKPNAYFSMNPSMYIEKDGRATILIRRIDYRKFHDKSFTLYNTHSHSSYAIMTGKLLKNQKLDLDSFDVRDLNYSYGLPTYNTFWKGPEDIRFINSSNILACVPECNPKGSPSIFHATLNNEISHFSPCEPSKTEKNWMPFDDFVIYSLHPFRIKSYKNDDLQEISVPEATQSLLKGCNGSTNGVYYKDGYFLFLIHTNKEKVYHRWILFNRELNNVIVSDEFLFFKHSYIEFPVSLCEFDGRYFVSLGVNDDSAYVIELNATIIDKFF